MAGGPKHNKRALDALSEYFGSPSITFAIGGAVSLITSGLIALVARDLQGAAITFLILGLVLILAAAGVGYGAIRSALLTRRGFYGFNTTAMTVLFLAIASIIIWVGAETNNRVDLTATRQFSLSQQTKSILKDLNEDIEAVAFFVPGNVNQLLVRANALDLLEEYDNGSGRFSFRVVDPELEPEEARRFGVNPNTEPGSVVFATTLGTLLFTSESGFLPNPTLEQDFTQAILAVTRTQQKVVYTLVRHGERDFGNLAEGSGFGLARLGLEGDNYLVRTLDLAATLAVPDDAAVLIIAGPENDLLEEEVAPLEAYLLAGGKALFLLDPNTPERFRGLLETWGVELGEGSIVDRASSVSGSPRSPLVSRNRYSLAGVLNVAEDDAVFDPLRFNPITQPITDASFYARATAVIPLSNQAEEHGLPNIFLNSSSLIVSPFAVTSGFSWLETDPEVDSLDDEDLLGPLAIGVSIDATAPFGEAPPISGARRTQIVVIGDSDFASNLFFTSFANGDIFLNSVNWLTDDIDLISVRPKFRDPRLLIVTQDTWNFIRWSSLLILPMIIGALGIFVWWRQR